MVMASHGQIFIHNVHPVQVSLSTTTLEVRGCSLARTRQASCGETAMQASQPVQRSSQIFAMVLERRGAAGFGASIGAGVGAEPGDGGLLGVLSTIGLKLYRFASSTSIDGGSSRLISRHGPDSFEEYYSSEA